MKNKNGPLDSLCNEFPAIVYFPNFMEYDEEIPALLGHELKHIDQIIKLGYGEFADYMGLYESVARYHDIISNRSTRLRFVARNDAQYWIRERGQSVTRSYVGWGLFMLYPDLEQIMVEAWKDIDECPIDNGELQVFDLPAFKSLNQKVLENKGVDFNFLLQKFYTLDVWNSQSFPGQEDYQLTLDSQRVQKVNIDSLDFTGEIEVITHKLGVDYFHFSKLIKDNSDFKISLIPVGSKRKIIIFDVKTDDNGNTVASNHREVQNGENFNVTSSTIVAFIDDQPEDNQVAVTSIKYKVEVR